MNAPQHLQRYPNARPSTIAYLIKRDETTERLRKEVAMSRPPQSRTALTAWLKQIARHMAKAVKL